MLLTSGMSAVSANAEPVLLDGIYYELMGGKAIVTNNGDPYSSYVEPYVEIPAVVEYEGNSYIVEEIGEGAFSMSEIYGVVLPSTIRFIGNEAFRHCGRLDYLRLPENLAVIGSFAFEWCSNLNIEYLPQSLYSIGENAFAGCRLPETLMIPGSLTDIMPGAFYGTQVKAFEVDTYNMSYTSMDGILCSKDLKTLVMMPPATELESYTVPSSFSEIGAYSFAGCGMKKIVVPENIKNIGSNAFEGCGSLTEISLPSTLTEFSPYMLSGCRSLKSLTIPDGVTALGSYSLSWCASLSEVKFPSSLKRIEWCAFYRTDGLIDMVLPEGLEYLGSSSFAQCNNLESVSIPSSVSDIPYSPFNGSNKLRRITVDPANDDFISLWNWLYSKDMEKLYQITPVSTSATVMEGTKEVMEMAAWGCKNLKSLYLPSTLRTIRDLAFAFCDSLTIVSIDATVPPRFSSDRCFRGVADREDCTLYVPTGSLEAYKNSAWNVFVNIKEHNVGDVIYCPSKVYLSGSFNGWQAPLYDKESEYVLLNSSADRIVYSGIFDFPAGKIEFKVFERPTDWSDSYGSWGTDEGVTLSGGSYTVSLNTGGNNGNIIIDGWSGGRVEIVLDLRAQKLTLTPMPDSPVTEFFETDKIVSGAKYIIANGIRVARPLQGNYSYGYLTAITADSIGDGVCSTAESNAFTITEKDGSYTIQGPDDMYYYMQGNYNNFNRGNDFPGDGGLWKISFDENGYVDIVNVYNNKLFVYSKDYHNYAAYSSINYGTNVLPKLYMDGSGMSVEGIKDLANDESKPVYYNLNGERVDNLGKGIYIRRQGNSSIKVIIPD
ncbi:MAG: leucine-rich repeat protein [Muribaculaceae bacterium]|nr:leucine-rich repeat protein [Muribaculaceae bacterium]